MVGAKGIIRIQCKSGIEEKDLMRSKISWKSPSFQILTLRKKMVSNYVDEESVDLSVDHFLINMNGDEFSSKCPIFHASRGIQRLWGYVGGHI